MHFNYAVIVSAALALFSTGAIAGYHDSCDNSKGNSPSKSDCDTALKNIKQDSQYTTGSDFSYGHCSASYKGDKDGQHSVSGKTLYDTMKKVIDGCGERKGSYGTGNCDECCVEVGYKGN